jgi:hypothetical protein
MLADGYLGALGFAFSERRENGAVLALIDFAPRRGQAFFLEHAPGRFIARRVDRFNNFYHGMIFCRQGQRFVKRRVPALKLTPLARRFAALQTFLQFVKI